MQLRRGSITTKGYHHYTYEQLMVPSVNIKLGIRRLAYAKKRCGGDALSWLSNYAGLECGPSKYSRRVLGLLVDTMKTNERTEQ